MTKVLILGANGQLRPVWFTREKGVGYRSTQKGQFLIGHDVSLDGFFDLIAKLAADPGLNRLCSIGVTMPEPVVKTLLLVPTRRD